MRFIVPLGILYLGLGFTVWAADVPATQPPAAQPPATQPVVTNPAPPVTVSVRVTPDRAHLGESLIWTAILSHPPGCEILFPLNPSFGDFRYTKGSGTHKQERTQEIVTQTFSMPLRSFKLGIQVIPSIEIPYIDSVGEARTVKTPPQRVFIEMSDKNIEALKLNEPKEPVVVPERNWTLIWTLSVLGGGAVLATLFLLIYIWIRRREKPEKQIPREPAHIIALGKLRLIEADRLVDQGKYEEFALRVSETVREYVGNRYGFYSLEMTSQELMDKVRRLNISQVQPEAFEVFLSETDLVKFAKGILTNQEMKSFLDQAYKLIEDTRERPELEMLGHKSSHSADVDASQVETPSNQDGVQQ